MESKQVWEKEEEEFGVVGICPCVLDLEWEGHSIFGSNKKCAESVRKLDKLWLLMMFKGLVRFGV